MNPLAIPFYFSRFLINFSSFVFFFFSIFNTYKETETADLMRDMDEYLMTTAKSKKSV